MHIISKTQARAQNITAKQIGFAAQWNEDAARTAKRRKDTRSASRHTAQAQALKAVAASLAG